MPKWRVLRTSAVLQDYRPGTSRADLEGDEKRQKTRNNLGEKGPGRYGRSAQDEKPKYDDGSFKGEISCQSQACVLKDA